MISIFNKNDPSVENLQLTVIQGDIVQMDADAIIHPTSSSFSFGGIVGSYLHIAFIALLACCCDFCVNPSGDSTLV